MGGIARLGTVAAMRVTPIVWLQIPADLPRPFGLREVSQWCPYTPTRSPLPWCSRLTADSVGGTVVLTRGLSSVAFSARVGRLIKWMADKERWQVRLASPGALNAYLGNAAATADATPDFDEQPRLFRWDNLEIFDVAGYKRPWKWLR